MAEDLKLLPCPFCGSADIEFTRRGTSRVSCIVTCQNCGVSHESSDSEEGSGASWNRRSDATVRTLCAERDAARTLLDHSYNPASGSQVDELLRLSGSTYLQEQLAEAIGVLRRERNTARDELRTAQEARDKKDREYSAILEELFSGLGTIVVQHADAVARAKNLATIAWKTSARTVHLLHELKALRSAVLDHSKGFDQLFKANLLAHIEQILETLSGNEPVPSEEPVDGGAFKALRDFLKVIATGPLSLRDALIAALAFATGLVDYIDLSHVHVLREHDEGWFGLRGEIHELLVEVEKRQTALHLTLLPVRQ